MRDQAIGTEPFSHAAQVLQAGISDKGTCSHASHELSRKLQSFSHWYPCHETRRGSESQEVLVGSFQIRRTDKEGQSLP